jgi:hypothetical protein
VAARASGCGWGRRGAGTVGSDRVRGPSGRGGVEGCGRAVAGRGGDGRAGLAESAGRSYDGGVEKRCEEVKKKVISAYVNRLCRVPVI